MKNLTKWGRTQNRWLRAIVLGAVITGLTGCATYVPIKSVRPPTIDTSNMQRLAIKPFENKSGVGGTLGAQLTQYLSDQTMQRITAFGKFTIVAPTDPNADGVFTGEIKSITVNDSQESRERKDKEGNVFIEITYKRDVSLEFQYSVISSRTKMPVGSINKNGSQSASSLQMSTLADSLTLSKRIVDFQLRTLQQDIVPTIVSTNRALMKETSKDRAVKQLMKMAQSLVKNNNYEEAIRQYDAIADDYGSVAARTNAKILRDAIASDIAARAELTELFNDKSGLAEKAARNAVNALNTRLPSEANIIIVKTNSKERSMIEYVVDQMTRAVVQAGKLRVIDRSNQTLIHAEQQYQLSGNVSDDSMVSIGHELGAQYMVLCWISGEMSTRRLYLRVLNVETAQITDQNDFEI